MQTNQRWISPNTQLPKPHTNFLGLFYFYTSKSYKVIEAKYKDGRLYYTGDQSLNKFIGWVPMPTLPQAMIV